MFWISLALWGFGTREALGLTVGVLVSLEGFGLRFPFFREISGVGFHLGSGGLGFAHGFWECRIRLHIELHDGGAEGST